MTPSKDVATKDETAPAVSQSDLDAIAAAQASEYTDDDTIQVPRLKLAQALTTEVKSGDAAAGDFVNSVTNESLGDRAEFIVAYYNRGRFADDDDGGTYVSTDDLIPENWAPFVGDSFVGTPFIDYPDAEETYKKRVNAGELQWGSGPAVSTTYNFTGFVVLPDEMVGEDADLTERRMVARLSLKRTGKKAADKIKTLQRLVLRGRPSWEKVLQLQSIEKSFGRNDAYIVDPNSLKYIRDTTPDEKAAAQQLALAIVHGRTQETGHEGDDESSQAQAAPEAPEGALGV
jgi:hypothetical protein